MNKIEVTPEMRARVLARIAAEDLAAPGPKTARFSGWKRVLAAAACLVLVLAGTALLPRLLNSGPPEPPPVMLPPDWQEASSLQELSGLVGFPVAEPPALPFEAEHTEYLACGRDLAQVTYTGAGQSATYRQCPGTQDNSGDYNQYASVLPLDADGLEVTLKGQDGGYRLALWTDGTCSYSLRLSREISEAEWRSLLAGS